MATLNQLFETFLSNINPDPKAVTYARHAHEPVRECLESQDEFKELVESSFLYGSYKRHTAVGDIKDVDIVILTNYDLTDEVNTPQRVLSQLKEALGRCYDDPENPQYQRRSIRIDDPLPQYEDVFMTLDIIPAVVQTDLDSPLLVPDRETRQWVPSHPKGHLRHTSKLNKARDGKLVPLVKMMKWWWQYQCEVRQPDVERPKPKGFWVECLTGEMFEAAKPTWADCFIIVLENIVETYGDDQEVPLLDDPGVQGEKIKTKMTMAEFEVFLVAVEESLLLARKARDTDDLTEASEQWRDIFGNEFPLYDPGETEESRSIASTARVADTSHAQPLPWPCNLQKRYKVRLDAYVYKDSHKLSGINSNGRTLQSGLKIKYVAKTKAGEECQIHWQVVNTGRHAAEDGGLRGGFFLAKSSGGGASQNPRVNWESTQYTGKHWIECFVVKNGECVGRSGRFFVNIRNPIYL